MKFKAFLIIGLTSLAAAQVYIWSHDTSFTKIKDDIVDSIVNKKNEIVDGTITSIKETKDNALNSSKEFIRNTIDKSAEKIGINTKSDPDKIKPKKEDVKNNTIDKNNSTELSRQDIDNKNTSNISVKYQIKFKYDHTDAPENLTQDEVLSLIQNASNVWEKSCGVKFIMDGVIRSDYISRKNGTGKDFALIRWTDLSNLEDERIGQAHQGSYKGPAFDFIMDLNNQAFIDFNGNFQLDLLQSTLVHEFGHTIGLDHSRLKESVMYGESLSYDENTIFISSLNKGDQQMCLEFITSWEKNPKNKRFKA